MAEKTNYRFGIIAMVAIVAIVGMIVLFMNQGVRTIDVTQPEPTATLIDDEGNIIGEVKGVKKVSGLKSCSSDCKQFSGEDCVACCGNYDVDLKVINRICYGKDWKIYYTK